ncbi:hypothetical protein QUA56_21745 [Microcoleus sp. N3A4]|uniref:hypothetical protein n=1 Tax=Microcoleus sp. N3A4 TaxID=3055379 RepID=UPI002FCF7DDF
MKTLKIVNSQKQPVASIGWESPNQLTVQVFDSKSETDLNALLGQAKQRGIPYRLGGQPQANLMVDEQIIIGPDHEMFLEALSQAIGQLKFGGQRVFGLIQQN